MSAAPRKDPPDTGRTVWWHRDAALKAKYLQLHAQLIAEGKPMSGRCGGYVYYWAYGRLCWRVYVIPKDPRTAAQRRSRAAFGTASKAWSENQPLTEEQRGAWYTEAAKTKSTPRLGLSGSLTGQQLFVGRNSMKQRWGLPLLLLPPARKAIMAEIPQREGVAQPSSGTRRTCAAPPSPLPAAARVCAWKTFGRYAPSQLPFPQRLTRPSSDRLHAASSPLPVHCRWRARSATRVRSIGLPRWSSTLAHSPPNAHFRELWRGG